MRDTLKNKNWLQRLCGKRAPFPFEGYTQSRMSPFDELALHELLGRFSSKNLTVLEIGSWMGAGSTQILAEYADRLVCVDNWQGNDNQEHKAIQEQVSPFEVFERNTESIRDKIVIMKCHSDEVGRLLKDGAFDFVFIDGDHRYAQTRRDILNCLPKVKKGGILAGHDCEGRVTEGNRAQIERALGRDHVPSIFPSFKDMHPGVIVAVEELLEGAALYAEDMAPMEFTNENGQNVEGRSVVWYRKID